MTNTGWKWWIVLSLGLAACASPKPAQVATPLPPLPTPNSALIQEGKQIYQINCAACHGANSEGAPNWATPEADGLFPAPPHDDTGHTWHHSDRVLDETIANGMGDPLKSGSPLRMPAFGDKLSDEEIRASIEYFKSLWSEEHRRWQWEVNQEDQPATPTPR